MSISSTSGSHSNSSGDFEIDIGKTNSSNLSPNLSITPDEKSDSANKDENAEKGHRREWITLAVTTSGVALGVIGLLAASFVIASVFIGSLSVTLPIVIAGGAFVACGVTLNCHKKIASVFDSGLTKLMQHFKKKESIEEKKDQ